jgi:hypothetical protein
MADQALLVALAFSQPLYWNGRSGTRFHWGQNSFQLHRFESISLKRDKLVSIASMQKRELKPGMLLAWPAVEFRNLILCEHD